MVVVNEPGTALAARMRSLLESHGVRPEEIDRAEAEGQLYLLTVDRLLVAGGGSSGCTGVLTCPI